MNIYIHLWNDIHIIENVLATIESYIPSLAIVMLKEKQVKQVSNNINIIFSALSYYKEKT